MISPWYGDVYKRQEGNHIILTRQAVADVRQAGVTGVVTDESGEPLIGVTVLVKGGSQGSVTDLEGKFTLVANVGDVLQFSYCLLYTSRCV